MRSTRSPLVWYPLALLVLAAIGGAALLTPASVSLSERDRSAYGKLPAWYAGFDALSAACTVGLTLRDVREQYTPLGRWVLTLLGIAGTVLHIVALRGVLARLFDMQPGAADRRELLALPISLVVAAAAATPLVAWAGGEDRAETGRAVLATFFGLSPGLASSLRDPAATGHSLLIAVLAIVGTIGLALCLRLTAWRWAAWSARTVMAALVPVGAMVGACLALAGCVQLFEQPRVESGWRGHGAGPIRAARAEGATLAGRWAELLALAHAGQAAPREPGDEPREGTRLVLALTIIAGGLSPASGGVSWLVLLAALGLASPLAAAAAGAAVSPVTRERVVCAARRVVVAVLALALIATLGLLVIEARVADRFETPARLGEAVLDASAVAGGGAATSGLIARLTSPHLSRGMAQGVDSYLYGMVWTLLVMFAGRIVPLIVLGACGPRGPVGVAARQPAAA